MVALPYQMPAWVVREERHGDPLHAMLLESVLVPKARRGEVIVLVKAAGINHNHLWACKGLPIKISKLHPEDPEHIGGSDAAGVVVSVGPGVSRWKAGDEVITHPCQVCGLCDVCLGLMTGLCHKQKAWGFETSYGSFAHYARVQAQQLLPKPKHLSWAEASSYGLKLFTTYRMLVTQSNMKRSDYVLIWGASGGMGSYAIQLCLAMGAKPICVVSSLEKADYCRSLGAEMILDRREFPYLQSTGNNESPSELKRFGQAVKALTGGHLPDIVFEHTGVQTFATSVFVASSQGKVVLCGATSGYKLSFDARYLWMQQKQIIGTYGCDGKDAAAANRLVEQHIIKPTLSETFAFESAAIAHQRLLKDRVCVGSLSLSLDL
ncbi:MAG: crotonyl-CoA carboxylase/reductase [Proteobacteria bacterium]|nr:MAG: crotonyl-CoA carboxylase/reductase [Pseudomonadota bacterium]